MHPVWKRVFPGIWRNILAVRTMKSFLKVAGLWCRAGCVSCSEGQVVKRSIRPRSLRVPRADRDPARALPPSSPCARGTGMSLLRLEGNSSCAGMHTASNMCSIARLQAALGSPERPCCNAPSHRGAGKCGGRESYRQK